MQALVAIFSILYNFWPLIVFFGLHRLINSPLTFRERFRLSIRRIFILWIIWAAFLVFIYWQGHQPVFIMPEMVNHLLFGSLGLFSGGVSIVWAFYHSHNRRIKLRDAQKLEDLLALSPVDFEAFVAELFRTYGYRVEIAGGHADHGVDLLIYNQQDEKGIVQCKRYSGSVGEPVVRDLYGTMQHEGAQRAYLITTGIFTKQALDWAMGKPIVLYDGESLITLIRRTQKRGPKLAG